MRKIFITLLAIFFFFACNKREIQDNQLTIGVMSSTDLLPYAIALKNGYFEQHNVNVKIQKFYSANDRDAAFHSRNIDGTITDLTGAIIQHANGIEGVITSKEFGVFRVMTNDHTIRSMSDLKGRRIASSKNTVIDFVIDMSLQSAGLTATDIVRQEVNKIPIRLEMLRNYKTDAAGLPEPFISIALEDGMKPVISAEELGYHVTCMFFHQSVTNRKQEHIKALYQAYNQAVEYIQTHDRKEYADVLMNELGVPEHLTGVITLPDYQRAGVPLEKDISSVTQWLKERNLIPQEYTASGLIDPSFLTND